MAGDPLSLDGRVALVTGGALGHDGIRVNSVHPGAVDTAMIASPGFDHLDKDAMHAALHVPRVGTPEDVAQLASDASGYCTGAEFVVDGGSLAGRSPHA